MARQVQGRWRVPSSRTLVCSLVGGAGLLLLAALVGCGSVADVGSGASRAGVEPVRGAYGYSGSGSAADLEAAEKRAESIARSNEKPGKKTAGLLKEMKQHPDEEAEVAAETEPEPRAGLEDEAKTKLLAQERGTAGQITGEFASVEDSED